jgi:class 3 adenylate cyclase
MVTSLFIALLVYCVMVVADVLLVRVIGDVPSGVLVARFLVVVPLWLTHYPLSQRCSAFYRESYSLVSLFALFCVLVMTGAASYIQRQIERDPIPGAQFYAPLPVAYAMYLCYVVFGMSTYWVTATAVAIGAGLFAEGWIAEPISQEFVYFAFWGFGFLVFGVYMSYNIELLALTLWHATVGVQRDKRVIDNKREQADALLKNIVPEVLIPDLTHALTEGSDLSALAKNHQQVCILFSDVAGFTAMSEKMDPFKLVNWLNALFQIFDKLADKYHVNKLKTIGDAYVACGGLLPFVKEPPPIAANGSAPAGRGSASALGMQSSSSQHQPQQLQQQQRRSSRASEGGEQEEEKQQSLVLQREHTNDVVNMALQVLEKVATLNESGKTRQPVSLRIGVHTGPLLAGIIGRRKFQYDIFGHSVHVAEEMESSGQVGRVHISTAAYRALVRRDTLYVFDEGPGIELEGGTREPTWFVMENKGRSRRDKVSRLMGSIIDTATSIRRGDDDEA